jgi:hypothetical protein
VVHQGQRLRGPVHGEPDGALHVVAERSRELAHLGWRRAAGPRARQLDTALLGSGALRVVPGMRVRVRSGMHEV